MARAALDWKLAKLAERADVGINTVTRFENGNDTLASTVDKMRTALERAGIIFIPENGGGVGVRLRKPARRSRRAPGQS